MKILVIGNGAREHAIAWKLRQSAKVTDIFVAPGNAGTAQLAHNINITADRLEALADFAAKNKIDLTVVGPEAPLAGGIVDLFQGRGLPVFGPTSKAARIESSKVFARQLMEDHRIPSPGGCVFNSFEKAAGYIALQSPPIVVKADGLASGKGVIIAQSREEARDAIFAMLEKKIFGSAGDQVILDEFLTGREVSLIAFADGKKAVPMVPACDYKRVGDNDRGPNTGGMGSYSPPGFFGQPLIQEATEQVLQPTIEALAGENSTFTGVLYAGLMVNDKDIKVLEFNARFGDPETQAVLPRLQTDLVEVMLACINGTLDKVNIKWHPNASVAVVMASAGYPGNYQTGFPISGLDRVDKDVLIFHSGTRMGSQPGEVVTGGGRVLTVTATGRDIAEARKKVYANVSRIHFEGCHFRTDIALREIHFPDHLYVKGE